MKAPINNFLSPIRIFLMVFFAMGMPIQRWFLIGINYLILFVFKYFKKMGLDWISVN